MRRQIHPCRRSGR